MNKRAILFLQLVLLCCSITGTAAIVLTADTCQEELLEFTCVVYNGEEISLWAPPYVDEFQMQFVLISSPLISLTVNGTRFASRLDRAEMVPSSPYANFEVVLTVTPPVSPLTIFCGNGFDSVNETFSVGGTPEGPAIEVVNELPVLRFESEGPVSYTVELRNESSQEYSVLATVEDECGRSTTENTTFNVETSTEVTEVSMSCSNKCDLVDAIEEAWWLLIIGAAACFVIVAGIELVVLVLLCRCKCCATYKNRIGKWLL